MHRLSDLGAVVTEAAHGTSQEGFDAEWRVITVLTVDGDLINRCELFDEADIDAALARFDELSRPTPRWKTRQAEWTSAYRRTSRPATGTRWRRCLADDIATDDRRRVVKAGDPTTVAMPRSQNMRAIADVGCQELARRSPIATRGDRLGLTRDRTRR